MTSQCSINSCDKRYHTSHMTNVFQETCTIVPVTCTCTMYKYSCTYSSNNIYMYKIPRNNYYKFIGIILDMLL